MGQAPKEAECSVAAKLVFFIKWKTAASGLGRAAVCLELVGKKGGGGSRRLLERCADIKVDIDALERLIEPEDEEVCLRYILKYSTRGGSNIFQLFDTEVKKDHFAASNRRWLERQEEKVAVQESWQNEWHDIKYQGIMAQSPPCPERTLKTPLPQQSSSSSRDDESQWVSAEDRHRRRVALVETAKRMLRYQEDSGDLKVGVTQLQEQLGISEEAASSKLLSKQ